MVVDKNEISLSGVIGDPIAHSKSPLIQNFWIKKNKLEGYYIPIRIPKGEIKKKIRFVKELGFRGLNVTVPHKVDAFYFADKLTMGTMPDHKQCYEKSHNAVNVDTPGA